MGILTWRHAIHLLWNDSRWEDMLAFGLIFSPSVCTTSTVQCSASCEEHKSLSRNCFWSEDDDKHRQTHVTDTLAVANTKSTSLVFATIGKPLEKKAQIKSKQNKNSSFEVEKGLFVTIFVLVHVMKRRHCQDLNVARHSSGRRPNNIYLLLVKRVLCPLKRLLYLPRRKVRSVHFPRTICGTRFIFLNEKVGNKLTYYIYPISHGMYRNPANCGHEYSPSGILELVDIVLHKK